MSPATTSELLTILKALRAELRMLDRLAMGARHGHVANWLADVGKAIALAKKEQ